MSWLFSRVLVEEYSEGISLDGEPSALLSGTPTQLPSWCSDKTMARCQLSQSGMTFKLLTGENGEAVLMSFLEAFPAPTSVVPGRERGLKVSKAPCGNIWQESFVKYDLNSSLWKTHQCLWDEDLPWSSVTLPKWGMIRSGVLWERITSPPLTKEIESGSLQSWPTPSANEDAAGTPDGQMQWMLSHAARSGCSTRLKYQKQNWPTARAADHKGAVLDRMPGTNKYRGNLCEKVELGTGAPQLENGKVKRLNPDWTEWLMGWPIGWTSLETITELDWRDWKTDPADEGELPRVATGIQHRIGRLKAIGNGQVPQVAALAWEILTGDRLNSCENAQDREPTE